MQNRPNETLSKIKIETFIDDYLKNEEESDIKIFKDYLLSDEIIELSQTPACLEMFCLILKQGNIGILERMKKNPHEILLEFFTREYLRKHISVALSIKPWKDLDLELDYLSCSTLYSLSKFELALLEYHAFALLNKKSSVSLSASADELFSNSNSCVGAEKEDMTIAAMNFGLLTLDSSTKTPTFICESFRDYLAARYIASCFHHFMGVTSTDSFWSHHYCGDLATIKKYIKVHRDEHAYQRIWNFVIHWLMCMNNKLSLQRFYLLINRTYEDPHHYKSLTNYVAKLSGYRFSLSLKEELPLSCLKIICLESAIDKNKEIRVLASLITLLKITIKDHQLKHVQLIEFDDELQIFSKDPATIFTIIKLLTSSPNVVSQPLPSSYAFFKRPLGNSDCEVKKEESDKTMTCFIQ